MGKKLAIIATVVIVLCGLGVGAFFIIKNISDENHKKDIEMAADCARTFDSSATKSSPMWGEVPDYSAIAQRRREKRQECSEKYHVTHQEIIDKIGEENYTAR